MARLSGFLTAFLFLSPLSAAGQPVADPPGRRAADDLLLVETHVLEIDGHAVEGAEIFVSEFEAFYLVTSSELDEPVMLSPRGRSVQTVDADKLERRGDVEARLAAGAAQRLLGEYRLRRGVFHFEVDGREARLIPAPPLLGRVDSGALEAHHKRYAHASRSYRPKGADLKGLALRHGEILVRVYFNSHDGACQRIVPKVLKLEEGLRGPARKIRFEYYGLPERLIDDEKARSEGVFGVPTADVYVDGEKLARLKALELDDPEKNLLPLLTGEH